MADERSRVKIEPRGLDQRDHLQLDRLLHRLGTHEIRMGDAVPHVSDRHRPAQFVVNVDQRLDRAVAHRMGCELQAGLGGRADHRQEPILRNEQDPAVVRIVDRVDLADAPRPAHIGAAGEHAAVEEHLDSDDAEHGSAFAERVLGHPADVLLNLLDGPDRIHVVLPRDSNGQLGFVQHPLVQVEIGPVGRTVANACDSDRTVVPQQRQEPLISILLGRLATRFLALDVPGATAKNARRLARLRVLLDVSGAAVGDAKVPVDAAELQGQRIEGGVGPCPKHTRVVRNCFIEFGPRGVSLLAKPCDEHLLEHDPLAVLQLRRPHPEVVEHVLHRFHIGDRVVELGHGRPTRVNVRIDQAGQDHLAVQIEHFRILGPQPQNVLIPAHGDDPIALHGHRLADGERGIDRDDLRVMDDQPGSRRVENRPPAQPQNHDCILHRRTP